MTSYVSNSLFVRSLDNFGGIGNISFFVESSVDHNVDERISGSVESSVVISSLDQNLAIRMQRMFPETLLETLVHALFESSGCDVMAAFVMCVSQCIDPIRDTELTRNFVCTSSSGTRLCSRDRRVDGQTLRLQLS